ncbi:class I SAM-dependent methyltransferase [Streptomyces sp. NPDC058961]|uniref:class I SAM-dependent methyltransferase n=1 Tax=Streptomyces sp. NPDC058961 TaxID=3346680 RepID=UPI0036BA5EA0
MSAVVTVGAWEAHYAAGRGFRPVMSNEQHIFERHVGPAAAAGLTALDIGCDTGEFAHYLTTCGYDVLGVDCAATAISRACEWAVGWQRVGVSGIAVWMSW